MIQLYWIITTMIMCQIKNLKKQIIFSCSTCKPLHLHFTFPSNLCICISHFLQDLNNAANFSKENSCTTTKIKELFSLSISMKVTITLKSITTLAFSIQSECNKIISMRKIFQCIPAIITQSYLNSAKYIGIEMMISI